MWLVHINREKRRKLEHIPKAIKEATANISPIANGKLERICKVFLLNILATPESPPFFFELSGTSLLSPLFLSSSVSGGGEASDNTIFCDTLFPLFFISWEFFSLQLMVSGRVWALFAPWLEFENGLNLKKGWKIGTLRKWVWGRHGFEVFMALKLKAFIDQHFWKQALFQGLSALGLSAITTTAVTLSKY